MPGSIDHIMEPKLILPLGLTSQEWEQLPKLIQDMYEGPTCTGCYLLKAEYDQS